MSLNDQIKNFSSYLLQNSSMIIKELTISHIKLEIPEKKVAEILSLLFCNDRGNYILNSHLCQCDIAMFGEFCQEKGVEKWKGFLVFQKVIGGIFFGVFFLIFLGTLLIKIRADIKVKDQFKRMLFTPKYLVLFNLLIFSISRFFYYIVDPYRQREVVTHKSDMMVYKMNVSGIMIFFIQLFIVWTGIYAVLNMGDGKISKKCFVCLYNKTKLICIVIMILVYPIQILVSMKDAKRITVKNESILAYLQGFFILIVLIIFVIFSICSVKRNTKNYINNNAREFNVKIIKPPFETENVDQIQDIPNKEEVIEFLKELNQNEKEKILNSYIFCKNQNDFDENEKQVEFQIDFEKEISILDQFQVQPLKNNKKEILESHASLREEGVYLKNNTILGSTHSSSLKRGSSNSKIPKKETYFLTKNDKKIIKNIFGMTGVFIIMLVGLMLINIIVIAVKVGQEALLTLLYFILIFELVVCIIVYILFFKDMKLQEYQNLKIIGEIDKYLNPSGIIEKQPKIVFDDFTSSGVFSRFTSFVRTYKQ